MFISKTPISIRSLARACKLIEENAVKHEEFATRMAESPRVQAARQRMAIDGSLRHLARKWPSLESAEFHSKSARRNGNLSAAALGPRRIPAHFSTTLDTAAHSTATIRSKEPLLLGFPLHGPFLATVAWSNRMCCAEVLVEKGASAQVDPCRSPYFHGFNAP